jgi:hypothetical protein
MRESESKLLETAIFRSATKKCNSRAQLSSALLRPTVRFVSILGNNNLAARTNDLPTLSADLQGVCKELPSTRRKADYLDFSEFKGAVRFSSRISELRSLLVEPKATFRPPATSSDGI